MQLQYEFYQKSSVYRSNLCFAMEHVQVPTFKFSSKFVSPQYMYKPLTINRITAVTWTRDVPPYKHVSLALGLKTSYALQSHISEIPILQPSVPLYMFDAMLLVGRCRAISQFCYSLDGIYILVLLLFRHHIYFTGKPLNCIHTYASIQKVPLYILVGISALIWCVTKKNKIQMYIILSQCKLMAIFFKTGSREPNETQTSLYICQQAVESQKIKRTGLKSLRRCPSIYVSALIECVTGYCVTTQSQGARPYGHPIKGP